MIDKMKFVQGYRDYMTFSDQVELVMDCASNSCGSVPFERDSVTRLYDRVWRRWADQVGTTDYSDYQVWIEVIAQYNDFVELFHFARH